MIKKKVKKKIEEVTDKVEVTLKINFIIVKSNEIFLCED